METLETTSDFGPQFTEKLSTGCENKGGKCSPVDEPEFKGLRKCQVTDNIQEDIFALEKVITPEPAPSFTHLANIKYICKINRVERVDLEGLSEGIEAQRDLIVLDDEVTSVTGMYRSILIRTTNVKYSEP